MSENTILDNQTNTVHDALRSKLRDAEAFSFVSAYFTIYGYELLEEELSGLAEVRFLFGDPASIEDLDPGAKAQKSFDLTEQGLVPTLELQQKHLALRCRQWVESKSVSVRSISRSNFLHGKMYLTGTNGGVHSGVVGSSNFTKRGLGGSDQSNLEINLATSDPETLTELGGWFDRVWNNNGLTSDVKQQVLDALNRLGRNYAPEEVYYKTLYELFRKDIDARLAGDDVLTTTGFKDSQVWQELYEFQKDGAKSAIAKLKEHNGCILADSVGLGKTYTALAVIKYFEQRNERVLVLCPRKLYENWSLYPASNSHRQNPFPMDRFAYTLLAHTDLSRDSGKSGNVDLANFNWRNYDLVVIDESHNFRNSDGHRYQRLLDEVIRQGAKTKVLMLSATPVNTSLIDLRNQIYLMTEGREDAFRESLDVGNIGNLMAAEQRRFRQWETSQTAQGRRDKSKLLDTLGADFLRLLGGVSIARSRRQIEEFYADEIDKIGRFPKRESPVNRYPSTDLQGKLSYKDLADRIGKFKLSVYQPSHYAISDTLQGAPAGPQNNLNFTQLDRETYLVAMMRTNFLKRLESSAHSLTLTLERTIGKIDAVLEKIQRFRAGGGSPETVLGEAEVLPEDDEEDEEFFVNRGRQPMHLRDLDLPRWQADLMEDKKTLEGVYQRVAAITPERDGKLREIKQAIRRRVKTPTHDQEGNPNRKMLLFTTFKDTAQYVYRNVAGLASELGLKIAMVSGDETRTTAGANNFNDILTNFAPVARKRSDADAANEIDLLIATDCISEGQNLQDCDTVLNYDIHWNPVRLIQRFGRIDRIGSRSNSVQMFNYWPTEDMDAYLKLESRVQARMALADIAATGDENPFVEEAAKSAQLELNFRDEQLLKLRDQVLDLDDLDDAPVMGDFTLDHFITQLLRYLEKNKDQLEEMPRGVYAVAEPVLEAMPGVVFFLRQRQAATRNRRQASPVHPFYFTYIQPDGAVRFGCGNARQTLAVFEAAAAGKTQPITALCDRFDRETDQGRNMALYDKLLNETVAHISRSHNRIQTGGLGIGGRKDFKLTPESESPNGIGDFDLITWLVIAPPESQPPSSGETP